MERKSTAQLPLDEISQCDPREVGLIAYMLMNGQGKGRANRTGSARDGKRWKLFVLSTGERTLAASMEEAKLRAKAGQTIRILDVPVDRKHGCFDELHDLPTGQAFADNLKAAAEKYYGTAGRAFLDALTNEGRDLGKMLEEVKATAGFQGDGNQAGRAAACFAIIGLAGELASEYGITGWPEGTARAAAAEAFRLWQDWFGRDNDEPRQIIRVVREFIETHGDTRFTEVSAPVQGPNIQKAHHRAGYLKPDLNGVTTYYFTGAGLKEATKGFDFKSVLQVLVNCGALFPGDKQPAKSLRVGGTDGKIVKVYAIDEDKLSTGTPAVADQAPVKKNTLCFGPGSKAKKAPTNPETAVVTDSDF